MNTNVYSSQTKKMVLAVLLILFSALAAQAAGPVIPDAGSILRQIQQVPPPFPPPTDTGLTIEHDVVKKLPQGARIMVKKIKIAGNKNIDTTTLHNLIADGEGKSLTSIQLDELVVRITNYYHSHGYPLARATLPRQEVSSGVVLIQIVNE